MKTCNKVFPNHCCDGLVKVFGISCSNSQLYVEAQQLDQARGFKGLHGRIHLTRGPFQILSRFGAPFLLVHILGKHSYNPPLELLQANAVMVQ